MPEDPLSVPPLRCRPCTEEGSATRSQALEIIATVLNDQVAERAQIRARLRWHLASDPENPETVLLKHLLERAALNNRPSWTPGSGVSGGGPHETWEPSGAGE